MDVLIVPWLDITLRAPWSLRLVFDRSLRKTNRCQVCCLLETNSRHTTGYFKFPNDIKRNADFQGMERSGNSSYCSCPFHVKHFERFIQNRKQNLILSHFINIGLVQIIRCFE